LTAELSPAVFAEAMRALGPFEDRPELAVAVSGGADSLALALLADGWAKGHGGRVVALTVDHGLRPDSADEARQVGVWLAARGIAHQILRWTDGHDGPSLQAAARAARYRLETLLLRLARGSGVDGLAAMAAIAAQDDFQLLRPLLAVPREQLRGFLREVGQDWIEDPSNRSDRFDRVRWRKFLAGEKVDSRRLALTARQLGRARQALEQDCARLAVETVRLSAAGCAWLDPAPLVQAGEEIALRVLAGVSRTIGGGAFPPRLEPLERLLAVLKAGLTRRRTFAGCVFAPLPAKVLVHREVRAVAPPIALLAKHDLLWDNRFSLRLAHAEPGLCLGALGEAGAKSWRDLAEERGIPRMALPSMPAIMDKHGILAVPPLGYDVAESRFAIERWGFTPLFPLVGAGFRLVGAPAPHYLKNLLSV
jgi:tRNA(Ile)-lysidine synthase